MSSDSDEPEWLTEQVSAHKEHMTKGRTEDSDDFSFTDDEAPSESGAGAEDADAEEATTGSKATTKASGKKRAPPSARLPLIMAPKVRRDMLLLEANDPGLDLSGDFGCIGKMHVRKASAGGGSSSQQADGDDGTSGRVAEVRQTLMLDLKGKVYDADILPSNTLCLLAVDGAKAKIEAVFSDFVQLSAPRDSIFDMKEVCDGQLDADFFDDGDVLSNAGGSDDDDDDDAIGPLREHKDGAGKKKGGGGKGKKAAPKKKPPGGAKKGGGTGAGAKRKASGSGGGGKKAKSG